MCLGRYIPEDDTLEVPTGDTVEIKEHIVAVLGQVLKNKRVPKEYWCRDNSRKTVFSMRSIPEHSASLLRARYQNRSLFVGRAPTAVSSPFPGNKIRETP